MSNPDTIALCVSDLLHSDRVDSPATILSLLDRLAAAEARNATLTDEAARYKVDAVRYAWVKANLQGLDEDDFEGAIKSADEWEKFIDGLIDDAVVQARAAASISTKESTDAGATIEWQVRGRHHYEWRRASEEIARAMYLVNPGHVRAVPVVEGAVPKAG